jgi:cytochrome c oxidase assembly factor 2
MCGAVSPCGLFVVIENISRFCSMSATRPLLYFNNPQRRKLVSSLFALTFLASIVTVAASSGLPCPARQDRARYADADDDSDKKEGSTRRGITVVEKKPRRWIEEIKR